MKETSPTERHVLVRYRSFSRIFFMIVLKLRSNCHINNAFDFTFILYKMW